MTPARSGPSDSRSRILATALEQIHRDGLTVSLEHLSLEQIIKQSGVSRATAYRHWPAKADFLADVLAAAVSRTRLEAESEDEIAALLSLLEQRRSWLSSEQGRRDLFVEGLRMATIADHRRVAQSRQWRTLLALHATIASLSDEAVRAEVSAALAGVERDFTRRRAEVYQRLLRLVGYRLRPPLSGWQGLLLLSDGQGALMTGLVVRAPTTGEDPPLVCAPFGTSLSATWPRPAFHLVHLLLSHIEPDPAIRWDDARVEAAEEMLAEMIRAAGDDGV